MIDNKLYEIESFSHKPVIITLCILLFSRFIHLCNNFLQSTSYKYIGQILLLFISIFSALKASIILGQYSYNVAIKICSSKAQFFDNIFYIIFSLYYIIWFIICCFLPNDIYIILILLFIIF